MGQTTHTPSALPDSDHPAILQDPVQAAFSSVQIATSDALRRLTERSDSELRATATWIACTSASTLVDR